MITKKLVIRKFNERCHRLSVYEDGYNISDRCWFCKIYDGWEVCDFCPLDNMSNNQTSPYYSCWQLL